MFWGVNEENTLCVFDFIQLVSSLTRNWWIRQENWADFSVPYFYHDYRILHCTLLSSLSFQHLKDTCTLITHTVEIRIQSRDICKRRDLEMWPSWGLEPPFVSFISLLPLVACAPCILSLVPSLLCFLVALQAIFGCVSVCLSLYHLYLNAIFATWQYVLAVSVFVFLLLSGYTCTLASFSNFILCSSALLCLFFFVAWTVLCHYDWRSLFVFVSPVPFCTIIIQYDNVR